MGEQHHARDQQDFDEVLCRGLATGSIAVGLTFQKALNGRSCVWSNLPDDDDRTVVVEAVGGMRLRGMCNGDATSLESLAGPKMKTFRGELVAVGEGATGELRATLQAE